MCKASNNLLKKIKSLKMPTNMKKYSVFELETKYKAYSDEMTIKSPEDLYKHLQEFKYEDQEHGCVIFLDSGSKVIGFHEFSSGLVNQTPMAPREAFREAIKANAVSVIFFHNHPSGCISPSMEDRAITRTLVAAGKVLQIPVLDHLIIGHGGFCSLCRTDPTLFNV